MRGIISIPMTMLVTAIMSAVATGTASAKHGKHWNHRVHGPVLVRSLPSALYTYTASPIPSFAAPAEVPTATISHAEWCTRAYQTYDPATDTFLRYDGVRIPCVGP
jgi:hypothetical protein